MTKEEFWILLPIATERALANANVSQICKLIDTPRTTYYRWLRGAAAPIPIARIGVIALLNELAVNGLDQKGSP